MIKPTTKASQTRRSALKSKARQQRFAQKAQKQQKAAQERGKVGPRLRAMILERDGGKCVLCGAKPSKANAVELHIHHVVPIAAGGRSIEENLATLCQPCNLGAGARTIDILRAIGHALKPSTRATA